MNKNPGSVPYLVDQARREMAYCYYTKAQQTIRLLLVAAHFAGNRQLHRLAGDALNECRRRHILGVLRHLNSIHPYG